MNIINKLTLAHLKENKGRTIVTILGIIVSVAMITAVFVSVASFMRFMSDELLIEGGSYIAEVYNVTDEQLAYLRSREEVSNVGLNSVLDDDALLCVYDGSDNENYNVRHFYVGDLTNLEQMVTCEYDGTLPKNENEVMLEENLLKRNKMDVSVGDKVSLSGREYTVCGILHQNLPTACSEAIRGISADELKNVNAFVDLKKLDYHSMKVMEDILSKYEFQYSLNHDLLTANFNLEASSQLTEMIIPMAVIVLAVIMVASVMLIYNAFGMSLSERTRYLGMLASVGATKKQKQLSVYFEGFILGLIGIPMGIFFGIIGIYITLKAVGSKIVEISVLQSNAVEMTTVVPPLAIAGIVVIAALTIFISAFIPAKKASSITPIEALKQSKEIKVNAKKLRSSKLIRKIFGYEGELANKNIKCNGRKARVITASIAMSIVLFMSVNYFCDMFVQSNAEMSDIPYQCYVAISDVTQDSEMKKILSEATAVDDYYSVTFMYYQYGGKSDTDNLSTNQDITKKDNVTKSYSDLWSGVSCYVNYVDDEMFNKLCRDNGINSADYYKTDAPLDVKCVVLNNMTHTQSGAKVFTDGLKGCEIYKDSDNGIKNTVSGLVEYDSGNYLFSLNPASCISAYAPLSMYINAVNSMDEETAQNYCMIQYGVETVDHEKACEQLTDAVADSKLDCVSVFDNVEAFQTINTIVFVLQVFMYGFIALITLIAAANIINTISTGMALRKKEFAMIKSVGVTPKGFRKMIALESLFYGLKAIIVGVPISVLVCIGMNKTLGSSVIPYSPNLTLYLIVIAAVFLLVGITMLYGLNKSKKDSVIETLKQDIL